MKNGFLTLLNVTSKTEGIKVLCEFRDESIEFDVNKITSKRNKEELSQEYQFTILNAYLDYKGDEFKQQLFNLYKQAVIDIELSSAQKDINPMPLGMVHSILDIFDIHDTYNYVKNIYGLKPPRNLKDVFDDLIEADARGSRVQTYLKEDYLELAAAILIIKAVMGPLGGYAYTKEKDIDSQRRDYFICRFITSHAIFNTLPMVKLFGLVTKLLETPSPDSAEADRIRVIEKQIPSSQMPMYIFSIVLIQKITIATLISDNDDKNIITRIYNYVNSRLRNNGGVEKTIRDKVSMGDDDTGEKESQLESYRITSSISTGQEVELVWACMDIKHVLKSLSPRVHIDQNVLIDALVFCRKFNNGDIDLAHQNLLSYIFKDLIDPRGFDYLTAAAVVNLMAAGFTYLWGLGFKNLAIILTSYQERTDNLSMTINSSMNRSRLTPALKEELEFYFPYKRPINAETSVNLVEEDINNKANDIFSKKWIPVATEKYLMEALGSTAYSKILPTDLKIQLASFYIANEKLRG